MKQKNNRIREAAKKRGVFLWQVADRYGITDTNFSKKLRAELTEAETDKILKIIEELAEEQEDDLCGE